MAEQQLTPAQTALYFCSIHDGVSSIEALALDESGSIANWPQDFFGDLTGDVFEVVQAGIKRRFAR